MRRGSQLAMAALLVGSSLSRAFAATTPPPPPATESTPAANDAEAPPPPAEGAPAEANAAPPPPPPAPAAGPAAAAPSGGSTVFYEPPQGVTQPGTPVDEAIRLEQATREIPDKDAWRNSQHLSWHMDWHLGNRPERYHHINWPNADRNHYYGHCRYFDSTEKWATARKLAEQEIAAEAGTNTHVCFAEDTCCPHPHGNCTYGHRRHVHIYLDDPSACHHHHHFGMVWANEWERSHPRYFWKITSDINNVGSAVVPAGEDHTVPPPRPVRWNDSRISCPLTAETFFTPPPDHTVVVPFPLPREGDWRAHISAGMNKVVDQTDWLRAVREYKTTGEDLGPGPKNCGNCWTARRCHRRKAVCHPQGD